MFCMATDVLTMENLRWASDVGMVFLPIVGYVPQYIDIMRSKSSEGFSSHVSLILLVSNILRIYFRIGKTYPSALLMQSLVMIAAQMLLLHRICAYSPPAHRGKRFSLVDWSAFWAWGSFWSYAQFVVAFAAVAAAVTALFGHSAAFFELLGLVSTLIESGIGLPQLWHNCALRSTRGLSAILIATWVVGDAFKTMYFVMTASPVQFTLCGFLQISVDLLIVAQIIVFHSGQKPALGW